MIKPITPQEVDQKKSESIPDFVYEAFNELIVENWNGSRSLVIQDDVVDRIIENVAERGCKVSRNHIFDECWLNIEDAYRKVGWDVKYDKAAYCESHKAFFTFSKK